MRLPNLTDRLIDLYSCPLSDQCTTLDILEEIAMDEYQSRRQNTIQRHLKQAKLSRPQAHVQAIDYSQSRKLNKDTIDQLKTCQFITNHRNVIIHGALVPASLTLQMPYVDMSSKKVIRQGT